MHILYTIDRLNAVLQSLSTLTGVSIRFLTPTYEVLCDCAPDTGFCTVYQEKHGCDRCFSCDRQLLERCEKSGRLEEHFCHAGLYDAAMPIVKSGVLVGYILMGRLRTVSSPVSPVQDESLNALYRQLPFFDEERLQSLRNLLTSILFSDSVTLEKNELFDEARDYIEGHLEEKLTVSRLCRQLGVSKNRLYQCFREAAGIAVNEYIIEQRLSRAKKLLAETESTISTVSDRVGLQNEAYFCRLFKQRFDCTPTDYRKAVRSRQ